MLQIGVIEPTTSAQYNSPCFLVNKKNNEKRFVLDLRSLNAAIMPELVQLPKVTELIDDITSKHCKFLSSLDLRAGYWQIPISKRSRPYTTFTAPLGMRFQYTVCPFGLASSPSRMLRVLLTVFGGKLGKSAFLYMDDICLADKSWLEHLGTLEDALRTLQRNDLTCNPTKCELGMANLEFLGFQIGSDGVKISRKKLAVLEKLPAPKNRKGLQRILGLFNYWRRFLKDYPKHTYHMRSLLAKDTPFVWSKH